MKKKSTLLNLNKNEWFLSICFIILFVGEIYFMFFSSNPLTANKTQLFQDWVIRIIRFAAIVALISSGIIVGIRSIRKDGYNHKKLIYPILGIIWSLSLMGISLYTYQTSLETLKILSNTEELVLPTHTNMLELIKKDLQFRVQQSKSNAKLYYLYSGGIVKHFQEDGTLIPYVPTAEDQEESKQYHKAKKILNETIDSWKSNILIWLIILILSFIIGLFFPIRKVGKPESPKDHCSYK